MNSPTPLSPLTDPAALSKIPILLIPVHQPSSPVPSNIYNSYQNLIKRYQTLRGDEISRPAQSRSRQTSSSYELPPNPRLRFFPQSTGSSISVSKASTTNHVHLTYTGQAPAKHTYPLSLLRLSGFPLIVLGIAVEMEEQEEDGPGYAVDQEGGDISENISTPSAPTFQDKFLPNDNPEKSFDETISSIFPSTSPFPLVKRLLVVPNQSPRSPSSPRKQSQNPSHIKKDKGYMRFAPIDGADHWVGRVLGEVVGELLGELGEIATALETPAGMRTLSSTLLPSLTSTMPHPELNNIIASNRSTTPSDYPSRPSTSTPTGIRNSQSMDHMSGMGISLTRALTPGGRPTSIQPPSLPPIQTSSISPSPQPQPAASSNPFRRSTALASPFTRTSSATSATSSSSALPQISSTKYTNATLTGVAGGRLMKLLGDMYLLAGLYADAIKCYDDGAERCRAVGDVLWEGLTREGRAVAGIGEAWEGRDGSNLAQPFPTSPIPVEILSHYLSALACISRSPLPYPPTILSPSPQAVSGSISFPAPSTSNPSSVGTGEGLLSYLHTSLSLKVSHFVLLIWAAGGWGSIALSSLMTHTLPRSFVQPLQSHEKSDHTLRRRRHRSLALLSSSSQITRQSIFAYAEVALQPLHRAMTRTEQLTIHNECIWLSRWLDIPRKEITITREVIKRLAILVVEGREESRKVNSVGFPSRARSPLPTSSGSNLAAENRSDEAAAVGLGLGLSVPNQTVAVMRKESTEGNSGIISLLERVAEIMGVDLLSFSPSDISTGKTNRRSSLDLHEEFKGEGRFGWPELQVEFLKEGIAVMESLPEHPTIIRLCLSALSGLNGYLNPQSQHTLNKLYPGSLATTRRRGIDIGQLPWWIDDKIVLSVEIASLPSNKLPIQHSINEIAAQEGKKDPFLYNPRLRAAEAGKTVLVANEQVDIFVTVRNPFAFDLEVQDLSILTSGAPFITSPLPLTLPANSVQTVRVTGQSPIPGEMSIKGVSIRLIDGSSTEILMPVFDGKQKDKHDKRRSKLLYDSHKIKRSGLDARYTSLEKSKSQFGHIEEEGKWLECKVVPELPLAWIKKTSLTHGTVMLYNGETSTVKITLENSSSTPIDFIKLTFDDSTSREAQAIISEGELTAEQAYEIEYDQLNRPVFIWSRDEKEDVVIPPGGRINLDVQVLGKVGCTDGTIRIDYGYLNRSTSQQDNVESSSDNTFYTRQITFPVLFTVYHTIESHSLDLTRLTTVSSHLPNGMNDGYDKLENGNGHKTRPTLIRISSTSQAEDQLKKVLQDENDDDHCLLSLSVRNVYGVPFEITLQRQADADDTVTCTRLIPPEATERMILPLPRRMIPQELLVRPIPSLAERQYIVDKEKKSPFQLKKDRELFWYREELLALIKATWMEPGSMRRGTLNLRDQYFGPDLLDIFKSDEIQIHLSLDSDDKNKVNVMDFVNLNVEVTNKFEYPFRPFIHISPLPTSHSDNSWTQTQSTIQRNSLQFPTNNDNNSISKNILFDGLSSTILPLLQNNEKYTYTLGMTFLSLGKFGIRVAVQQVESDFDDEKDQKIWFSEILDVLVK
ncbi:uncharacterized protein I206_104576 [Kwoniella pini CBS 10737]|uniref:Uncharacterized protein n=1 Tax=Kwoniella pini CBS 10737 TaxID=1296096 RepID=A0A1B9I781_9TREE|nr:uncharacterized protein I206_02111 [Kwoniella pini CBS 10737]OCF51397.1 hypothetical protein I206_02111 [Kwoniella pini CBS 10737]